MRRPQTEEGRARVYLGSATGPSSSPDWFAEGNQGSANFGFSVASASDVNGDGYSDVIVGARGYDNGEIDEGRAYVYLGSATGLSTSSDGTVESDWIYARFGWSVSAAGDLNGDGYGDVIAARRSTTRSGAEAGRVARTSTWAPPQASRRAWPGWWRATILTKHWASRSRALAM